MKNNLTVSVVLATYNGEEFLAEQIDSILNQSVLPDEIIFVDDCSKDTTLSIIYDFKKIMTIKGIDCKVIQNNKNIGYIENFFNGISIASKDLIFLSDQDDLWKETKIERNIQIFKENIDILALHGNANVIDQNGSVIKFNQQEYKKRIEKIELNEFIKKVNYPGMSLVFRNGNFKKKLMESKKDIVLNTHDWFICLLASLNGGFYISNEVLTLRRFTGRNVALDLDSQGDNSMQSRLEGIHLYSAYYEILQKVIVKNNYSDEIGLIKYIKNINKRKEYLEKASIMEYVLNITNINYYPSKKSYIKDGIVLIKYKFLQK